MTDDVKTTKMKVKNISKGPYGANTADLGTVFINPGEVYEGSFTDGELAAIQKNAEVFATGTDAKEDPVKADTANTSALEKQVADLTAENASLKSQVADLTSGPTGVSGPSGPTGKAK